MQTGLFGHGPGPLVAIDARLVGYAAGIARYTTLLVEALAALDGPERYVVLRGQRGRWQAPVPQLRVFTPPHNRLERWTLPLEVASKRQRPALLHSVDNVATMWGPWRSVVTLFDLAFMLYPETHTPASRAYYAATSESVRHAERVI